MFDALKLCVFCKGTHRSVIILHEVDGVQYVHIQMYTLRHILSTPDDTRTTANNAAQFTRSLWDSLLHTTFHPLLTYSSCFTAWEEKTITVLFLPWWSKTLGHLGMQQPLLLLRLKTPNDYILQALCRESFSIAFHWYHITVKPHLVDTPEIRTSIVMWTLCALLNVSYIY